MALTGRFLLRHCLLLASVVGLLLPRPASAQPGTGTLRGRVVDAELGEAIAGATVRIRPGNALYTSDSLGRFEVTGLPVGDTEFLVQALGYERHSWKVNFQAGQVIERTFPLEFNGEQLPEVVVTARANKLMPRYVDFERRRDRGIGAFMRWEEIKAKNFNTVGEALRSIRGVRVVCDQAAYECFVRMARTMNCSPLWFVDGVQVASFHENTSIRDVYGIEVFRGPGEVPGEFAGSDSGCGVIALWTKSRPYR